MSIVEKSEENLKHCRCPVCPVEYHSKCSRRKLEKELLKHPLTLLERKAEVAKLYCSFGKTDCTDMDTKENCHCPKCPVWEKYDLKATYFCVRGAAEENKI